MREQLLGYLLGALEPSEQASVEASLAVDPELRRELEKLRSSLRALDDAAEADDEDFTPPPGLGARTFQFVRAHAAWNTRGQAASNTGAWKAPDYLIAAGIFFVASMLVFPAIQNGRAGARLTACQDKLRLLGMAMTQYAQIHGHLPFIPATGNMAAAGAYAPILQESNLLESPSNVLCPESTLAGQADFRVPTFRELEAANPQALQLWHRVMGGSYGYHPGHIENDRYVPTRDNGREHFAVMADAVDEVGADRSCNHGQRGQNVLCLSGRVVFIVIPRLIENGDHIYVNDHGVKGAGRGANDSSICNSSVPPVARPVTISRLPAGWSITPKRP
ncbi:MAG TPA: hypothetical protein VGN12_02470 [Pirellulales bacterium]